MFVKKKIKLDVIEPTKLIYREKKMSYTYNLTLSKVVLAMAMYFLKKKKKKGYGDVWVSSKEMNGLELSSNVQSNCFFP